MGLLSVLVPESGTTCFFCGGTGVKRGAYWMGHGETIHMCSEPGCVEKLLEMAVDCIEDRHPYGKHPHRQAEFDRLRRELEIAFWRKQFFFECERARVKETA